MLVLKTADVLLVTELTVSDATRVPVKLWSAIGSAYWIVRCDRSCRWEVLLIVTSRGYAGSRCSCAIQDLTLPVCGIACVQVNITPIVLGGAIGISWRSPPYGQWPGRRWCAVRGKCEGSKGI